MSIATICDHCQKAMDIRSFNESQTTVTFHYEIYANVENNIGNMQDVCPHCAIAILQQLVQA